MVRPYHTPATMMSHYLYRRENISVSGLPYFVVQTLLFGALFTLSRSATSDLS